MLVKLIPFIITVFGTYFIIRYAIKAWNKAPVEDKKDNLESLDSTYEKVISLNKKYKKTKKKRKTIKNFLRR